ncbi:hypothetical protein Tco_0994058, partial [Tanacetum coccineum]
MISHLATPVEDELLGSLSNVKVISRAYQTLRQSVVAQGDLLKRHEQLNRDFVDLRNHNDAHLLELDHLRSSVRRADQDNEGLTNKLALLESVHSGYLEPKTHRLEAAEEKIRMLETEKLTLSTELTRAEADHQKLVQEFIPSVVKRLHTSAKYRQSLAASEEKHRELFTKQYSYVQKVADSYLLPMADLLQVSPDVPTPPPVTETEVLSVEGTDDVAPKSPPPVQDNVEDVMTISVILVSSDSSEESVRTSTGRVILFGTIPTTIPNTTPSVILPTTHIDTTLIPTVLPTTPASPDYTPASPDYTPASPDYSPASDMEFDPSEDPTSDHIPPLPATLPFLSSTNDSSDSDTPDLPPLPTHGTPFTETTLSAQRSPVASGALRRRVMVLAPGQPIPHGRPYRYYLNRPVHMMTARKRVGPLPTLRLAVRHLVDYFSSDHFSLDDSLRDSSLSSSSETSLDSSADALSDFASSRSSFDHSLPTSSSGMRPSHHLCSLVSSIHRSSVAIFERPSHDSSSTSPSRKRSRSPATSVPLSS